MILSIKPARSDLYDCDEENLRRLFPSEEVEETMEIMREAAEVSEQMSQDVIEYQDWMSNSTGWSS